MCHVIVQVLALSLKVETSCCCICYGMESIHNVNFWQCYVLTKQITLDCTDYFDQYILSNPYYSRA